uniref:Pectate lyase C n=1 Tax=Grammatophora oceanica TaxID=210454 RepID=A0A7S1UWQ8_9STRA|mmetsp:Transcript_27438/g.40274  ORF Transcript_27438/g.40274 Transcript_27438/m.40274 type:complete len:577 (+) Transcript_27438:83-1813(+)
MWGIFGRSCIVLVAYVLTLGGRGEAKRLSATNQHDERRIQSSSSLVAFPGAVGYGRYATGGRGGTVIYVSNLNDSGPGSFREAVEVSSGPRTVVFEVSGTITVSSQVRVDNGDLTIAGQTSPGGITLRGSRLKLYASNVIVRGMRFRPGDGAEGDATCDRRDGFGIGQSTTDPLNAIANFVFDHCSCSWALDENGSSWYASINTTVSNSIFAEGITDQCDGTQSFGYLIGTSSGTVAPKRISMYRNVFANNRDRNPRIADAATEVEIINNYGYNWRSAGFTFSDAITTAHAINNAYKHGPDSQNRQSFYLHDLVTTNDVYLDGNIDSCFRPDASMGSETDVAHQENNEAVATSDISSSVIFSGSGITELVDASSVADAIFPTVGAIHPARDSIDTRILSTANHGTWSCADKGTGTIITSVDDTGDFYPDGSGAPSAPVDSDGDGIPDLTEIAMNLDPNDGSDAGTYGTIGYTYLEEYLNSFYDGIVPSTPSPTTGAPTSESPTTANPITPAPTTPAPTTPAPTSPAPTTPAPTSTAPTTPDPTTGTPFFFCLAKNVRCQSVIPCCSNVCKPNNRCK